MIHGKTLKGKIKSEIELKVTGVQPLKEFLRSQKLRWFGHVEWMSKEKAAVLAMTITLKGKKEDLKK